MISRIALSLRYRSARLIARVAGRLYRVSSLARVIDLASLGRLERIYGPVKQLPSAEAVFGHMLDRVDPTIAHTYLEFGVYRGRSLRWWSGHLDGAQHRLVGFDSFEGLPEQWNPKNPVGHFDRGGSVPTIDDDRISYVVGWFDDTVPGFERPHTDGLIVNIDCDLYSSTKVVLDRVGPWLAPGDQLYFDEFGDLDHEYPAWLGFAKSNPGLELELVAVGNGWRHVAFQVVATPSPV